MSNTITATITGVSLFVAERNDLGLVCQTLVTEARPASLDSADEALAFASLGRTSAWDLDNNGGVEATVAPIQNRFNGTVAARLWEAIGTTHDEIELASAHTIQNGDIITDADQSDLYVVAGSSWESDAMTVHMVAGRKTWDDRYTSRFGGLVHLARKR
jgi:hypothetical protein